MGGKGGGSSTPSVNYGALSNALNSMEIKPSPYEQQLARIAGDMYSSTGPLRGYFLEDFGNFLRPPGYTPAYATPSTSQAGTTGTANAKIPAYSDIYSNLSTAFSPAITSQTGNWDFNQVPQARDYLSNIGADPFQIAKEAPNMSPTYTQGGLAPQVTTPNQSVMDDWVKNKAQSIFNEQVAKGMQQISQGTGGTSQPGQTTPPGFTNQNLYNPYNLPGYAPLYQLARTGLESQYNPARENIMASTPRGGALYENLAGLEMSRAQQAGELPATIAAPLISDIYNKAYGTAFQTPQTSIAGLSAANQGLSSRTSAAYGLAGSMYGANSAAAMQQAAMNQQSGMALAGGLGSLAGMGVKAAMK